MGRPRKQPGNEPPTVAVKLDRVLVNKAKMIATDQDKDTAQYLSEALRSIVEKDWAEMVRKADGRGKPN